MRRTALQRKDDPEAFADALRELLDDSSRRTLIDRRGGAQVRVRRGQ